MDLSTAPDNPTPAFDLPATPTGAICNLACAYCFFLDKELLHTGSGFRMPEAGRDTHPPWSSSGETRCGVVNNGV